MIEIFTLLTSIELPLTENSPLFLLGYKGNLYTIDSDFHINQTVDGVDSIGAGSKYCLAAFDALTEIKSIKQRMFKALDITVNRCTLVSKPYIYEVLKCFTK